MIAVATIAMTLTVERITKNVGSVVQKILRRFKVMINNWKGQQNVAQQRKQQLIKQLLDKKRKKGEK